MPSRYRIKARKKNEAIDTKEKIFPVDGQHRVEGIKAALNEKQNIEYILLGKTLIYIKDYEKKYLTTDTGEKIRVGDKVRIVNKYYSGYSLCVPGAKYAWEADVWLHTTEAGWESQMWMFIRGAGNRVHIVPYQKPIYFVYIHYQTLFVDLRELEVYTPNLNKYWHEYGGGKYDVKYQSSYNAFTFVCLDDAPQGSNNLLVLCAGDVTETNYRDVIPGYEYNTTNTKNMWIIKKG